MNLIFDIMRGFITNEGKLFAHAYSGYNEGKNNFEMQKIRNLGPIPEGEYDIVGPPCDREIKHSDGTTSKMQYVLQLLPCPGTNTFGRSGFLWHGDNGKGGASHGCLVSNRYSRKAAWEGGARRMKVIGGYATTEAPPPLPSVEIG